MSVSSAAFRVEAAVIGAGVIGLAAARALALRGKEVVIVERAGSIGSGTSSRNSEVVHAGIYYQTNSLKAELCVRGRNMLYDFCASHGIDCRRIGKLIVATDPSQVQNELRTIKERADANGATDLCWLSPEDLTANFEPDVICHGALLSPSTGVVDSHGFMISLLGEAEENGASLALHSPVEGARVMRTEGGILLTSAGMDLLCDNVVNCAGLFADKVASLIRSGDGKDGTEEVLKKHEETGNRQDALGAASARSSEGCAELDSPVLAPRQYFAKGNYYRLEGQKSSFRHLVYPVPERGGLGVHVTIDLGGNVRFGPDVEWIDPSVSDPDSIDITVDVRRADAFYAQVRKYWPSLEDGALAPDYAGIRPKLGHPDVLSAPTVSGDFIIEGPKDHGIPGLVNLFGIESPGLTASMAIAERIAETLLHEEK